MTNQKNANRNDYYVGGLGNNNAHGGNPILAWRNMRHGVRSYFGGQFRNWFQALHAVNAIVLLDNEVKSLEKNYQILEDQHKELIGQNDMLRAANEMLRDSNELMRIRIESKQSQTDKKIAELLKDIQEIKDKG